MITKEKPKKTICNPESFAALDFAGSKRESHVHFLRVHTNKSYPLGF